MTRIFNITHPLFFLFSFPTPTIRNTKTANIYGISTMYGSRIMLGKIIYSTKTALKRHLLIERTVT